MSRCFILCGERYNSDMGLDEDNRRDGEFCMGSCPSRGGGGLLNKRLVRSRAPSPTCSSESGFSLRWVWPINGTKCRKSSAWAEN